MQDEDTRYEPTPLLELYARAIEQAPRGAVTAALAEFTDGELTALQAEAHEHLAVWTGLCSELLRESVRRERQLHEQPELPF